MLSDMVNEMEKSYVDMASAESGTCKYTPSCDPSKSCTSSVSSGVSVWTKSDTESDTQFNNPTTQTCTRFDRDPDNEFLSAPVTGRKNSCTSSMCPASNVCEDNDSRSSCKCHYPVVLGAKDGNPSTATLNSGKPEWLDSKGCTSGEFPGDKSVC